MTLSEETPASLEGADPRPVIWRPAGWALGLPAVALVWLVATLQLAPSIEHALRRATLDLKAEDAASPLSSDRMRAAVSGRDVTIVADLGLSEDARRDAERLIAALPGIRKVRTETAVPVAMRPATFVARRTASGISLEGGVLSAEARTGLVADAATIVPADSVDDRLRLVADPPAGFDDATRFALRLLAHAPAGQVSLSDTAITVRLTARDPEGYDAVMAALKGPPLGFVILDADVLPPIATPFGWRAERDLARLTLSGSVPSEALRATLLGIAADALPGTPVEDRMRTARGSPSGLDFAAMADASITALSRLRSGHASLAAGRFALSGEGVGRVRVAEVERDLAAALPRGLSDRTITTEAVPAAPFVFAARRASGRVVLTGYVPDEAEQRAAASQVAARFPGERIVDDLVVADGAPAGFRQARSAAVDQLGELAEGEAALRDRDLRLSGRMLYRQLADRVRQAAPRLAPPGWTATVAIDVSPSEKPLDVAFCSDLLTDSARRDPIRFEPGAAAPVPGAKPALAAAADILRRCGPARIRVVHRIATSGDLGAAQRLAAERAAALVEALAADRPRVTLAAAGAASSAPRGEAGPKPESDRTEFLVEP